MTIGERIQMYRKSQGLSQEDLAQKIFVSRQTVSQWETDQTVPSIDNIYRLKEVLGVSFDELLSDEKAEKEEAEEEKPLEEYEKTTSWEELKFAFDKSLRYDPKKIILLVAFVVISSAFSIYVSDFGVSLGFMLCMLLVVLIYFGQAGRVRSKIKKELLKNGEKLKHIYKLYTDRLEIRLFEEENMTGLDVLKRDDIKAFYENEKYYAFQARSQIFTIEKSLVSEESYFYNFIYRTPENKSSAKPMHKIISALLIVASLISPVAGFILMGSQSDYFDDITGAKGWMMLLLLPVPIISILYGIYLNKKRVRNKGNIIIGAMILAFLFIIGVSSFSMTDYYYSDISRLTKWEEKIRVDFPDSGEIVTSVRGEEEEEIPGFFERSVVRFDEAGKKAFMKVISSDERWVYDFPDSLSPCFDGGYYESVMDYNLLYNVTTGEVNTPPEKSGEYRFVLFKYLQEDGVLEFEEYIVEIDMGDKK